MADEKGQVGYDVSRLLRLLNLTTNCHLAQDILSYFTGSAPALPSSLWRFPPLLFKASLHGVLCRAVLCRAARFARAARFLVFLASAYRHNSFDL